MPPLREETRALQTQTVMFCIAWTKMQPINMHACPPEEVANMVLHSESTWQVK